VPCSFVLTIVIGIVTVCTSIATVATSIATSISLTIPLSNCVMDTECALAVRATGYTEAAIAAALGHTLGVPVYTGSSSY
jgi:hypothetical protein